MTESPYFSASSDHKSRDGLAEIHVTENVTRTIVGVPAGNRAPTVSGCIDTGEGITA